MQVIEFAIQPNSDIVLLDNDSKLWKILGDNPEILFISQLPIPVGWVQLHVNITYLAGAKVFPYIEFAIQGNWDFEHKVYLRYSPQHGIHTILPVPHNVTAIRLIPSERREEFFLKDASCYSIPRYKALFSLAKPYIKEMQHLPQKSINLAKEFRKGGIQRIRQKIREKTLPSEDIVHQGSYAEWIEQYDKLTPEDRLLIKAHIASMQETPLISILMPVYNTPSHILQQTIESVLRQMYPHWELCIADDHSTESSVRQLLEAYVKQDSRIKVLFREQNGHISAASNSALALCTGSFAALLDHDDTLSEHALYLIAAELNAHPDAELLYSDEDKIDENGTRTDPNFKPDWNPDLLLSQNYISHLGVYKTSQLREIGGFREGFEGSQDYDLVLRFTEQIPPDAIRHIPFILYHWRAVTGSTADNEAAKMYAHEASLKAVKEHFSRMSIAASVEHGFGFQHRIRYSLDSQPLVSIIIPTHDGFELLKRCISSIKEKTTYRHFEIIVVDNRSSDPKTLAYLNDLKATQNVQVIQYDQPFNFSKINNVATTYAQGEVLCFLNNDIEVIEPEWLTEMVSHCQRPGIGAVGAKLLYPDNRVQHGGVILGIRGVAGHAHKYADRSDGGYFFRAQVAQNFSAVTAACLLICKAIFEEIQGFDEGLSVAFNDVDFCLRVRDAGYRNVWTPFALLYHYESATRGDEDSQEKQLRARDEVLSMLEKWKDVLQRDPAYNLNLTMKAENFDLGWPSRSKKPWLLKTPLQSTTAETYNSATYALMVFHMKQGYGVDLVAGQQIKELLAGKYKVILLTTEVDEYYETVFSQAIASHQLIIHILHAEEVVGTAPMILKQHHVRVAIAHTQPFYFALPLLDSSVSTIFFDHGEPPPEWFEDRVEREKLNAAKKIAAEKCTTIICISEFIKSELGNTRAMIVRPGNEYFVISKEEKERRKGKFRSEFGLEDKFIVLNVTRFTERDRIYKGVDQYIQVMNTFKKHYPELADQIVFVIAGKGNESDISWTTENGLVVLANPTDDALLNSYIDCDFYLSMSQWEGHNLGIGQAMALGKPVAASDRGAHREWGFEVSNDVKRVVIVITRYMNQGLVN